MTAAERRRQLGMAAIYSVSEAARLLPGRDAENVEWLREQGLVRRRPGTDREEVRWGDVYELYERWENERAAAIEAARIRKELATLPKRYSDRR